MNRYSISRLSYALALVFPLFFAGCVGTDDDGGSVPYTEDSDSHSEAQDAELFEYDSDYNTGETFDFNLDGLPFRGVNMSGAEWDGGVKWPDRQITRGYVSFPNHFRGWGLNTVRLPFKWERLQPQLRGSFDEREWNRLKTTVYTLRADRARIIIDCHNYARFNGVTIPNGPTDADLADLWTKLAVEFKNYPEVMFGIMNEPYDMPTEDWVSAANAAIAAIRATGARNLIFLNGNAWSGAHSWYGTWYGTANAEAMLDIVDPLGSDYTIFEAHQYLNEMSSDWGDCVCSQWEIQNDCTNDTVGAHRMQNFTYWLRENGKKGFLGEFGVQADATCMAALDDMLNYIEDNADVYVGWTWWSAGPACVNWQAPTDPFCWGDWEDDPDFEIPAQMQALIDHVADNPDIYVNP